MCQVPLVVVAEAPWVVAAEAVVALQERQESLSLLCLHCSQPLQCLEDRPRERLCTLPPSGDQAMATAFHLGSLSNLVEGPSFQIDI